MRNTLDGVRGNRVTDQAVLFEEAKADLQVVSEPLFDLGQQHVRNYGAFLPFGALLTRDGKIALHAAAGASDRSAPDEILPRLHEGLRAASTDDVLAVAVCEWVKITPPGAKQTDAVKVLVEHANGLTVAFYLPMSKRLIGGWQAGDMIVTPAAPEVGV